ncbi:MAG TPA: DUF554 domain-containing protein [Bacillota bacterium]|nr:DUF554 domain-containing protein [Bacillota bacterium]
MIGLGTLVNFGAIVAGSLVGLLVKKGIPEGVKSTVMQGIGLAVSLIGLKMAFQTQNELILIGSLALGGITGEILGIEERLNQLGNWIESKVGGEESGVSKAFVSASLIYCVGAMAIMGAIQDGLTGQTDTLFAKSALDGITSVVFASTMGIGVMFSAVPVLVYQGAITLAAASIKAFLSPHVIAEMTATGGLLILGIGLNTLGIKNIKVGNLLPAIVFAVFLTQLADKFPM